MDKIPLSDREKVLLQLVAKGHTSGEIAKLLFISEPTVTTHRSNIMKKLQVRNMAEAVAHSLRNKLID
ncbi:MAG: response regulator transcription factor [Chitinophagales bacterium]|nr:response regulator transcription factor [Chitinophagales bacterium]